MRSFILAVGILAASLVLAAGSAMAADPIEGIWQTEADEGAFAHVTIAPCGPAFCGVISKSFRGGAEAASPNTGRQIVIDMAPKGGGAYTGKVWRPANDKIYTGKAQVSEGAMKLSGCVAGGLLCKSQNWRRVR